jgi:anti-sigma factor RsiW
VDVVDRAEYGNGLLCGAIKASATTTLDEPGYEPQDDSPNPERALLDQSRRDRVRQAISLLEPEFREAIVLREIEGLSYKEIAAVLNISHGDGYVALVAGAKSAAGETRRIEGGFSMTCREAGRYCTRGWIMSWTWRARPASIFICPIAAPVPPSTRRWRNCMMISLLRIFRIRRVSRWSENWRRGFWKEEKSPSRFWNWNWLNASVMAAAAIVVMAAIVSIPMLRTGRETDAVATEILDSHLRALQAVHQVDVPSSDQHTVKPWFQGKTAFSPPVPDLTKDDFILVGGRLEVIHQQPAAAIVYRRRQHVIDLYVSPAAGADSKTELRDLGGYHLLRWTQNNLSYWAVSDVDRAICERLRISFGGNDFFSTALHHRRRWRGVFGTSGVR